MTIYFGFGNTQTYTETWCDANRSALGGNMIYKINHKIENNLDCTITLCNSFELAEPPPLME